MDGNETGNQEDWLQKILNQTQLSKFYTVIRHNLLISRPEHFNFVKIKDLEEIGLSRPAARRLLDAVKQNKIQTKSQKSAGIVDKILGRDKNNSNSCSQLQAKFAFDNLLASGVNYLICEKDVTLIKKLGDGAFGLVKKGEWTTPTGEKVPIASKILKLSIENNPESFIDFIHEVNSMYQLNHPHLIRLYGIVLSTPLMMIQELAPLGCLLHHLRSNSGKHPNFLVDQLFQFCLQLASACQYLGARRLIHRDVAARNIFLIDNDRIKLGDFGLMKVLPDDLDYYFMEEKRKMPFAWCAPESLRSRKFSSASDCWMVGVTFWELFSCGSDPWKGLSMSTLLESLEMGKRLDRPRICPVGIYDIMKKCWDIEPTSRPSFTALISQLQANSPCLSIAKNTFEEEHCLSVEVNDSIILIDHKAENFWCFGQNKRTKECGKFPRSIVDVQRKLLGCDISSPLRNSFIHTGHMGKQGQWGKPDKIDEVYLVNPMQPPDLLIGVEEETTPHSPDRKSHQRRNSVCGSHSSFKRRHSSTSLENQTSFSRKSLSRSQSALNKPVDDLIDFSDTQFPSLLNFAICDTEDPNQSYQNCVWRDVKLQPASDQHSGSLSNDQTSSYYCNTSEEQSPSNQDSSEPVDRYLNLPTSWKPANQLLVNQSNKSGEDPFDLSEVCRGLPQSSPFAEVLMQFAARQKANNGLDKSDWSECIRAKKMEKDSLGKVTNNVDRRTTNSAAKHFPVQNDSLPPPLPTRTKPPIKCQQKDLNTMELTNHSRSFSLDSIISQQVKAPIANPESIRTPTNCYLGYEDEDSDFDSFTDTEEEGTTDPTVVKTKLPACDESFTTKCNLDEENCQPPPVPRRLTSSSSMHSGLSSSCDSNHSNMERSLRILPIKKDGEQMSHTHYWLLPNPSSTSPSSFKDAPPLLSVHKPQPSPPPPQQQQPQEYCNLPDCKKKYKLFKNKMKSNVAPSTDNKTGYGRRQSDCSNSSSKSAVSLPTHSLGCEDSSSKDPLKPKIDYICATVSGVTSEEARVALCHLARHDVSEAVQCLKVQQLFRLGLASQAACKNLLIQNDWNLEKAGAMLVDRYSKGSSRV